MIKSGEHLGAVRRWIQRNAANGDRVIWGSDEELKFYGPMTSRKLDELAQEIRDAVMREYSIKERDHDYTYRIFCEKGSPAIQYADTMREIWSALFSAVGKVFIDTCYKETEKKLLFQGTAEDAREWCRKEEPNEL